MRRRLALVVAGVLAVTVAAPATALLPRGEIRFVDLPAASAPIAPPDAVIAPVPNAPAPRVAMLASPEPDAGRGPPVALDPRLVETTALGGLPRKGADGRTPLGHYARPAARDCSRPCVAVVISGLGLADRITERALTLPGEVALSFSPYGRAAVWQERARAAGHETLLGLPLAAEPTAADDRGPLAIGPDATPAALRAAALRILAEGGGYVALDGSAGAFAADPGRFAPLAEELSARGLALIEIGGQSLAAPSGPVGLPYAGGAVPIDLDPSPAAVERALAEVAAAARAHGRAIAVAQPLPGTLDRLAAWIARLPEAGLALVPPSVLLAARAGAVAGRDD